MAQFISVGCHCYFGISFSYYRGETEFRPLKMKIKIFIVSADQTVNFSITAVSL